MIKYWQVIEQRMKELGITFYRVAEITNIKYQTIQLGFKHNRPLNFEHTSKIAAGLALSLDDLNDYELNETGDKVVVKQ